MHEGPRREPRSNRVFDLVTIVLFCAAICAPLVGGGMRSYSGHTPVNEFRTPAKEPPLRFERQALVRYPRRYEAYHADNFGLRDWLIRAHNVIRWFVFGVSPTDAILLGRENWIYYRQDHALEAYRGVLPFTEQDLAGWTRTIESQRDWCAERGIEYLFGVVPSKEQLYPEYLPESFERGTSRVDQLVEYLGRHSDVSCIDLAGSMRAEKALDGPGDDTVYRRLGTHWTDRGAWAAYGAIAEWLSERFPSIEPWTREQFTLSERSPDRQDCWGGRLYMEDLLPQEEYALFPSGRAPRSHHVRGAGVPGSTLVYEIDDATLPRAVVYHDSNGAQLRRFIGESFSEVHFNWTYRFDLDRLALMKPDVVLMLVSDRALVFLPPEPVPEEGDGGLRSAFDASDQVLLALDVERNKPPVIVQERARILLEGGEGAEAFTIESRGPGSKVVLPEFDFPAGRNVILRLEIESPADTELILAFQTLMDPEFDQHRSLKRSLHRGRNVVFLELLTSHLDGPLLLRPGIAAGDYVVFSIEARAVPY